MFSLEMLNETRHWLDLAEYILRDILLWSFALICFGVLFRSVFIFLSFFWKFEAFESALRQEFMNVFSVSNQRRDNLSLVHCNHSIFEQRIRQCI